MKILQEKTCSYDPLSDYIELAFLELGLVNTAWQFTFTAKNYWDLEKRISTSFEMKDMPMGVGVGLFGKPF